MSKYEDMTDNELGAFLAKSHAEGAAATKELWRRYKAGEGIPEPPVIEPPVVSPPSMSASEIIAYLEEVVPTEESLLAKIGETQDMPRFGEQGFKDAWTLRDGQVHMGKRWNGLGDGPDDTNAYLRVPGKSGSYGYIDSLHIERCIIEEACNWGARLHGVRQQLNVYNTLIRNIRREHGLYLSLCGGESDPFAVELYGLVFSNVASQSFQSVQRDQFWDKDASGETPNPEADFTPGGDILVGRCRTVNGGGPEGTRESFDFSFFRSRNGVYVTNQIIDDRAQAISRGFQMAQGYHGLDDDYERLIDTDGFLWRSASSQQQAVSYQDMSVIRMRNGVIDVPEGSNAKITLDGCSEDFLFENVTSLRAPVRVVIDGVDAGTVDELSGAK